MSTDKQSADSPADQIARCRDFARAHGWIVVEGLVLEESAISGASRHNRPGFLGLFNRIDEWYVLLAWDYPRLTRDPEDYFWIANRLAEADRTAYDCMSGRDLFDLASQMMGVINHHERLKIAENTRRGLRGRFERGFATGGAPHGYTIGADKRLVIDAEAAQTVRRIFEWSAEGEGLRAIAYRLNAESVKPPRPRRNRSLAQSWSPAAVQAILENPLYKGELIFGRTRWKKVHSTGGRRSRPVPENEWLRGLSRTWRSCRPSFGSVCARLSVGRARPTKGNRAVSLRRRGATRPIGTGAVIFSPGSCDAAFAAGASSTFTGQDFSAAAGAETAGRRRV
jgi:DNA invertase Pin-like site-specific DNA recombinase